MYKFIAIISILVWQFAIPNPFEALDGVCPGQPVPGFDIKIPVNPGSSGSPVINDQAQAIGIVFASTTVDANGK